MSAATIQAAAESVAQAIRSEPLRAAWLSYAATVAARLAEQDTNIADLRRSNADLRESVDVIVYSAVCRAIAATEIRAAGLAALVDAINALETRMDHVVSALMHRPAEPSSGAGVEGAPV